MCGCRLRHSSQARAKRTIYRTLRSTQRARPNPAMEGEMAVQIPMDLNDRHTCPIPCQGMGGIRPRTGSGGRMGQGRGEAPRAKPLEGGGAQKANRAFRLASPAERERPERQTERSVWLRQRNAKEKPLPVQEIKPFPPCATCAAEGRTLRSRNLGREKVQRKAILTHFDTTTSWSLWGGSPSPAPPRRVAASNPLGFLAG